jgi:hypothetical protein
MEYNSLWRVIISMNDWKANHLVEGLKRAGLRLTPQRVAICRLLAESKDHLDGGDDISRPAASVPHFEPRQRSIRHWRC